MDARIFTELKKMEDRPNTLDPNNTSKNEAPQHQFYTHQPDNGFLMPPPPQTMQPQVNPFPMQHFQMQQVPQFQFQHYPSQQPPNPSVLNGKPLKEYLEEKLRSGKFNFRLIGMAIIEAIKDGVNDYAVIMKDVAQKHCMSLRTLEVEPPAFFDMSIWHGQSLFNMMILNQQLHAMGLIKKKEPPAALVALNVEANINNVQATIKTTDEMGPAFTNRVIHLKDLPQPAYSCDPHNKCGKLIFEILGELTLNPDDIKKYTFRSKHSTEKSKFMDLPKPIILDMQHALAEYFGLNAELYSDPLPEASLLVKAKAFISMGANHEERWKNLQEKRRNFDVLINRAIPLKLAQMLNEIRQADCKIIQGVRVWKRRQGNKRAMEDDVEQNGEPMVNGDE